MRSDRERLVDILEAIEKIERHTTGGKEAFDSDELLQVWIIHHLQTVGEAASKLDREFQDGCPEIPWAQIVAMRNILIHDYFAVDLDEVWIAAERDIPRLKKAIVAILDKIKS
jgi:uncharacterized protein with HEPN domain